MQFRCLYRCCTIFFVDCIYFVSLITVETLREFVRNPTLQQGLRVQPDNQGSQQPSTTDSRAHRVDVAMTSAEISLRTAQKNDLESINGIIEAAVMTWKLPQRVKRLSLPSYRYTTLDLDHFEIVLAESKQQIALGVAAWEPANPEDTPADHAGLLLHGIYVDPCHQHQGIGGLLFDAAQRAVDKRNLDGLLVKAQQDANGFFVSRGMSRLPVEDPVRHYANRFWKHAQRL